MTDSKKSLWYRCIFLTLVLLAVYGNTLNHGFVWDDTDIIVDNPLLESLANTPQFFVTEDRIETASGYYRPMAYLSFALDRALWGLNPVGFNLTNLLLHIATALTLYLALRAICGKERPAFLAALLFSLHPLAGETVNFHAGGRNTLLCALFFLLALLFHLKKRPLPALLCFAVAIFSKEFALLLPPLLYVQDRFLAREKPRPARYAPYLIAIVCYFLLRSYAVEQGNLLASLNFSETLWLAPWLVLKYLANMLNPFGLKVLYDLKGSSALGVASLAVVALLAAVCYRLLRRGDEIGLALFWYLLFLLPVINIVIIPSASLMADRYAYFSLMGFSLALASLIGRTPTRVGVPVVLSLCALFALIDVGRNGHWRDDLSFFTQMTEDAPDMAIGHYDLGIQRLKRGELEQAEKSLLAAAARGDVTPRLLRAGAGALWEADRVEAAERLLLRQVELEPANPQPYVMLKTIAERKGNPEQAKAYRDKAQALFPGIEQMMAQRVVEVTQRAEAALAQAAYARASTMLLEALAIDPGYVPALIDMGSIHAQTGAPDKALKYLKRAVSLDPGNASALYNLSMLYQMQGRGAEAEAAMQKYNEAEALAQQKAGKTGQTGQATPRVDTDVTNEKQGQTPLPAAAAPQTQRGQTQRGQAPLNEKVPDPLGAGAQPGAGR